MKKFIVKYLIPNGGLTTEEVEAEAYVPLPQKVANFYEKAGVGDQPPRVLISTFYEVVSVTVKK